MQVTREGEKVRERKMRDDSKFTGKIEKYKIKFKVRRIRKAMHFFKIKTKSFLRGKQFQVETSK